MVVELAHGPSTSEAIAPVSSPREIQVFPEANKDTIIGINPKYLSFEDFNRLEGSVQEAALLSLFKSGDKGIISRLRPDFRMAEPLTEREITMSDAIDKITKRDKPIKGFSKYGDYHDDWEFTKISSMVYDHDLTRKLEAERVRRHETPGLFFSHEVIGVPENYSGVEPARRYRRLLEREAEKQLQADSIREELKESLQVIQGGLSS